MIDRETQVDPDLAAFNEWWADDTPLRPKPFGYNREGHAWAAWRRATALSKQSVLPALRALFDAAERVWLTADPVTELQGAENVVVGYRHRTGAMHALRPVLDETRTLLNKLVWEQEARAAMSKIGGTA